MALEMIQSSCDRHNILKEDYEIHQFVTMKSKPQNPNLILKITGCTRLERTEVDFREKSVFLVKLCMNVDPENH